MVPEEEFSAVVTFSDLMAKLFADDDDGDEVVTISPRPVLVLLAWDMYAKVKEDESSSYKW